MAAANESQGLKIAVAAFVTLAVILAVTSYFLYSSYSRADAAATAAEEKASKAQRAASDAVNQYNEFRQLAGVRAEEFDAAKTEAATHFKKLSDRIEGLATATANAIQKAKQAGAEGKDMDEALGRVQTIIGSYRSEPNKNFISTVDRLAELMENVTLLNNEMSSNYQGVRKSLEATTSVAKGQIDVHAKAASDSKADLEAEHGKHEQERQTLLTKVDQLQTDNDKKATQIANLETQYRQFKEETDRKHGLDLSIIRELRDRIAQTENFLDKPDGYVTFVDHDRREVHVNITRHQGARPQMKMTIFDASSPGIPTEKPKGNIEIIQVGDRESIGRITRVASTIEPIRVGDIVYSPAWSPEEPMRFALIGKIDVNRDGKDDREDLKRMIKDAGGSVDYDLPPPGYGNESGKLTARIDWYVTDERMPYREVFQARSERSIAEESRFKEKYGQVIKQARAEGIRPMPIGRLLAYLGYEMGTPLLGHSEGVNTPAMRRLIEPRKPSRPAAKAATEPAAKGEEMKDETKDQPKDEAKDQPKDEAKDQPKDEAKDQPKDETKPN
jgi:hypothetical protein